MARRGRPRTGNRPGRRVHRRKGIQVADSQVLSAMDDIEKSVDRRSALKALRRAAKPIRAQAEANAPVRQADEATSSTAALGQMIDRDGWMSQPGFLKDNIVVRTVRKSRSPIPKVEVGPTKRAFWGMFYEFGTHQQPARPFLRPAFDSRKFEAQRILRSELWKTIQEAA